MSFADPSARLTTQVCRRVDFDTAWFKSWVDTIEAAAPDGISLASGPDRPQFHRKNWEWAAVSQALAERGMLQPGRRGIGFAVGREPLACLFAARGADILATDLAAGDGKTSLWSETGQHAASLDALHWPALLDRTNFDARVGFMPQDMRDLKTDGLGTFDFLWSACSFEHLGSLEAGLQFVLRSMDLLKPGGIAVHTTEFNVSSVEQTLDHCDSVIYRQQDVVDLECRLRRVACGMERPDFFAGTELDDLEYDFEPFYQNERNHIKLMLGGFVTTSLLLIIRKGRHPGRLPPLPVPIAAPSMTPVTVPVEAPTPTPPPVLEPAPVDQSAAELEVLRLRARLEAMERSTSWKLTEPLRAMMHLLRGGTAG